MWYTKEEAEDRYIYVDFSGRVLIENGVIMEFGAYIGEGSSIRGGAIIGRGVHIGDDVHIGNDVSIRSGTRIKSCAYIGRCRKNVSNCIVILGEFGDIGKLTGFKCDDGLIITCGCFNAYRGGTPDELRQSVSGKYDAGHFYFDAIKLIEKWYEGLE